MRKHVSLEDKTVFELIDRLNKNPNDHEAAELLPVAYSTALQKRNDNVIIQENTGIGGDRWMAIAKQREVCLEMYNAIKNSPASSKAVPNIKDPTNEIISAKQNAAAEYYHQGLLYMNYNNRNYALKAYDIFVKADKAVPGYKDVALKIQEAQEKSVLRVVVRSVKYYHYNWSYWGFSNDWLQQEIVRDLNAGSFRDVRFFTEWEAGASNFRMDRVVEISFPDIYVGNSFTNQRTYNRSKKLETGTTKSIPPRPVYTVVNATVYVTRRYLQGSASLECRIYDWATGNNILFDRFPRLYNWTNETARFTGDRRALEPEDWRLINNSYNPPPQRNMVAQQLIRDCYYLLINRIRSGVTF